MEVAHQYVKLRKEFGHHTVFADEKSQLLESVLPSTEYDADYIRRNPIISTFDTSVEVAEHACNTDRVLHKNQGMRHFEGGWPENVDGTEAEQVDRYLKKANKETSFKKAMMNLGKVSESAVRQNNAIDIFEEYFPAGSGGATLEINAEPPSAKGVAVFRDPSPTKRSVTAVSWHPEGTRIAVAYSVLRFQDESMMNTAQRLPPNAYVWDVANPNAPVIELEPSSPLVCIRFNVKTPDVLIGGSYNGLVHVFDIKKPRAVVMVSSSIDRSHHDPVYDVFWIQSKTNNQFASVSTDGRMLWWDTRKLSEPTDEVVLQDGAARVLGGTSMEYNIEAGPAKYLVGTEQGIVLQMNMKKKGGGGKGGDSPCVPMDSGPGKHHGPIYTIQRNPFHPTNFMTIGDWGVRFWNEKNKPPIMQTPYAKSYLTCGSWSPTRAGLFFVGRQDGVVDAWDFYHKQSTPTYSHKVSEFPISCVSVQGSVGVGGRLIAIGDTSGTVSLLDVSDSLAQQQPNEKLLIGALFDRESKREEALEKRAIALARQAKLKKDPAPAAAGGADAEDEVNPEMQETLNAVDNEFNALVAKGKAADAAAAAAEKAATEALGGAA